MIKWLCVVSLLLMMASVAHSAVLWDTLDANRALAVLSDENQPLSTEAADDFWFPVSTADSFNVREIRMFALTTNPNPIINNITAVFYQSFPIDSNTGRTPVSVRDNGPADNEFASFSVNAGNLTASLTPLGTIASDNTILGGTQNQFGVRADGIKVASLWEITLRLSDPLTLFPASSATDQQNHYFISIIGNLANSDFYWLAGARPPSIYPGDGDEQAWIRTDVFQPDWRPISDVINQQNGTLEPAYNLSFRISDDDGVIIPELPASLLAVIIGMPGLWLRLRKQ